MESLTNASPCATSKSGAGVPVMASPVRCPSDIRPCLHPRRDSPWLEFNWPIAGGLGKPYRSVESIHNTAIPHLPERNNG
jgi:hypothetical protein